jgi:hypothetical protein
MGELALLFIRYYRALCALTGGDPRQIAHRMHTENRHTRLICPLLTVRFQEVAYVLHRLQEERGAFPNDESIFKLLYAGFEPGGQ